VKVVFLILEVAFHGGDESMVSRILLKQNVERRRRAQISSGRKSEKRELTEHNKRNLFWGPICFRLNA